MDIFFGLHPAPQTINEVRVLIGLETSRMPRAPSQSRFCSDSGRFTSDEVDARQFKKRGSSEELVIVEGDFAVACAFNTETAGESGAGRSRLACRGRN